MLRYSAMVNGFTELAITLLDVLTGLETVKICRAYRCDGSETDRLPSDWESIGECIPIYDELPGWTEDISAVTRFDDLPANAKEYVRHIERLVGVPVSLISVGPAGSKQLFYNLLSIACKYNVSNEIALTRSLANIRSFRCEFFNFLNACLRPRWRGNFQPACSRSKSCRCQEPSIHHRSILLSCDGHMREGPLPSSDK